MLGAVKENLRNLISYFDVIKYMVKRDLKITYGRYILSYGWTLLEPLLFTLVFYLVFVVLRGNPDENLPINIMIGILFFSCFSKIISQGTNQLMKNSMFIQNTALPREILMFKVTGFQVIRLILSLIIVPVAMMLLSLKFSISIIMIFLAIAGIALLAHGISMMTSIVNVYIPDTFMLIDVALRALFFLSGVFYSASHMPDDYLKYHMLNPVAVYIEIGRAAVFNDFTYLSSMIIGRTLLITLAIYFIGTWFFMKYNRRAVVLI